LTDWRIAGAGSIMGFLLGTTLAGSMTSANAAQPMTHLVVLGFAWLSGLTLGVSGANLRRERLKHSLATIGIMAHELRTPLSTAGLIADALLLEARRQPEGPRAGKLEKLGQRLHALTRSMNHHIDMQISNARLLQLSQHSDTISAQDLVTEVVAAFPYRTSREVECVEVVIHNDFMFRGARTQFLGVLDNLIQNALRSLQASSSVLNPGDLRFEVGSRGGEGRITVADRGIGIEPASLQRIFEPFFSSDHGTGHGLGLAFCKRVVLAAHGSIRVNSEPASGAVFTISLPVDARSRPHVNGGK
jgi:two-component system CAI-1 autoinducer sensor kinase/phosphatase CqsS